ncbi:MAG: cytochrome c [Candidatus Eremiobacteraeota bacterium]|nr:cytochrome c [Candidatus Eremiobacteraeota bacterium]MBV9646081.1 cytochrome c [Candidatus Eremiobacteraeota bacterium]
MRRLLIVTLVVFAGPAILRGFGSADGVPTQPLGEHMEVTLRAAQTAQDKARADTVVVAARRIMAEYPTVADAERAGFKKFAPRLQLPVEHYTNGKYALEAWRGKFNAMHPTSLIFERTAGDLKLVGVMYTASNRATEEELNADVPLSIGTWHRHVNFCVPPLGTPASESFGAKARFYFGTIASAQECHAAHGFFVPRVFGWMIHVWPNESDPAKVWAVERHDSMEHAAMLGHGPPRRYDALPIPLSHLPQETVASGNAVNGRHVFDLHCAECHGAAGRNGPDAPTLAGIGIAPGQVAYMVRHPQAIDPNSPMPQLPLTDDELADVAVYVASLK